MSASESLVVEAGGRIKLPARITDRYHLAPDTQLRIIEAKGGILLVPLTDDPMSEELKAELSDWQALAQSSLENFPFEE
jgi:bifunctional DNA-binding transcriptional regulator/antitoxin component of YhaV-PrlF toxin-antitoxin module